MVGLVNPEEPVITKESVQTPPVVSSVAEGPIVVKESKSNLTAQTSVKKKQLWVHFKRSPI